MKTMKKALCFLMAVLLLASAGTFASAEESDPFTIDEPKIGFRFVMPEKYKNHKGSLDWKAMYLDVGITELTLSYYAFPLEDFPAYDDYFGELSHPDYTGITEEQYANRMILRDAMLAHGFKPLAEEWWHFTLENEPYPDTFFTFPINSDVLTEAWPDAA